MELNLSSIYAICIRNTLRGDAACIHWSTMKDSEGRDKVNTKLYWKLKLKILVLQKNLFVQNTGL